MQAITELSQELLSSLSVQNRQRDESLIELESSITRLEGVGSSMFQDIDTRVRSRSQEILDGMEAGFAKLKESLSSEVCLCILWSCKADAQLSDELSVQASLVSGFLRVRRKSLTASTARPSSGNTTGLPRWWTLSFNVQVKESRLLLSCLMTTMFVSGATPC